MRRVCWRKLDGTMLARIDGTQIEDNPDRIACLPLNRLAKIIMEDLLAQPTAQVKWDHKVTDIGQDENKAWVDVETSKGVEKIEADYIVGCDGANSAVRRGLFGKEFPGFTWDEQVVATNTYYDFDQFGWEDSNFIVHPEHWYMAARISKDGMWRVSYGEKGGLSREEYRERLPWKFETMLPGHPKPDQYRITNFSPYKVHQRCAEKMRVGRFLLAADAAHLCNPFGGLGLTGGIADVGSLVDCLMGMYEGKAGPEILDKYDEIRRDMYQKFINPISTDNIRRLFDQDPEKALDTDDFFKLLIDLDKDPEKSRAFQLAPNSIEHDFSPYMKSGEASEKVDSAANGKANGPAMTVQAQAAQG